MNADDVFDILAINIPHSQTWKPCAHEPYGVYNARGLKRIKRVLFCVTANDDVVDYFRRHNYDLLISHHPYVAGPDIPQFIAHTPLDCCKGGLNDMWAKYLGVKQSKHFDRNLGEYGKIDPIAFSALLDKVRAFSGDVQGTVFSCKDKISSVAICTGLGGWVTKQALATGADCYIVGEMTSNPKESGFESVIEVGHTLSEWMGSHLIEKLLAPHGIRVHSAPLCLDNHWGKENFWYGRGQLR